MHIAVEIVGEEEEEKPDTQSTQEETLEYKEPTLEDATVQGVVAKCVSVTALGCFVFEHKQAIFTAACYEESTTMLHTACFKFGGMLQFDHARMSAQSNRLDASCRCGWR